MEGSGALGVTLTVEQGKAQLDVEDNGKGMPRRIQRQIFDHGFSTKARGWGLGLSLVKRIVKEYLCGQIVIHRS